MTPCNTRCCFTLGALSTQLTAQNRVAVGGKSFYGEAETKVRLCALRDMDMMQVMD